MVNLHSKTLNVLREVLAKFKRTNDSMKAASIDLLYNIKNAYYRFIKASKLTEIIKKRPAEMITVEILRRYKNNVEKIHTGESSSKVRISEISSILDLLRAFFIVNY